MNKFSFNNTRGIIKSLVTVAIITAIMLGMTLSFTPQTALAVPAYDGVFDYTQPDGVTIQISQHISTVQNLKIGG